MPTIKNKYYRKFMDEGIIETITESQLEAAINSISHRYKLEAQCLLILLYYTGARPAEALSVTAEDVSKDAGKVTIKLKTIKRGMPRTLYLPSTRPLIKKLWEYARSMPMPAFLFGHFRSKSMNIYKNKKGEIIKKEKLANRLSYWFDMWFDGITEEPIPPYYLRHHRFSKFAERGATIQDIQLWKGSKDPDSVMPYLHMTTQTAKKLSRML